MKVRVVWLEKRTYKDWLLLCFFLGILGGTAAALLFGQTAFKEGFPTGREKLSGRGDFRFLGFWTVYIERAKMLLAGWMVSLSAYSKSFFGLFTLYIGMCISVSLSLLTMQKGIWGLPVFLWRTFPQSIAYLTAWSAVSVWAGSREKKLRFPAVLFLLFIVAAGAFFEYVKSV